MSYGSREPMFAYHTRASQPSSGNLLVYNSVQATSRWSPATNLTKHQTGSRQDDKLLKWGAQSDLRLLGMSCHALLASIVACSPHLQRIQANLCAQVLNIRA